ncbi:hypothetical protein AERO9AM_70584 [Aeromicrobium sp. 9AM]|nr:hypothetical protein AERO9AM_70584 [Aeromicrobium sp. 9AM]
MALFHVWCEDDAHVHALSPPRARDTRVRLVEAPARRPARRADLLRRDHGAAGGRPHCVRRGSGGRPAGCLDRRVGRPGPAAPRLLRARHGRAGADDPGGAGRDPHHRTAPDRLPLVRRRPSALALAGPHRRDGVRGVHPDDRRLGRAGRGDGSVGGQLTRRQHAGARRDRPRPAADAVPGRRGGVRLPRLHPAARRLVDPLRDHPGRRLGAAVRRRSHVRAVGPRRRRHLRSHGGGPHDPHRRARGRHRRAHRQQRRAVRAGCLRHDLRDGRQRSRSAGPHSDDHLERPVPGLGRVGRTTSGAGADPAADHTAADATGTDVAAASVRLLVASGPASSTAVAAAVGTPAGVATAARTRGTADRTCSSAAHTRWLRDAPRDAALPGRPAARLELTDS